MTPCILAIDQGTTNTKVLLVDGEGAVVSRASVSVDVRFPKPGWVEQDAAHIWQTVQAAIDTCLSAGAARPPSVVAISNQRESALAWERATGKPLGPCIVWQCRRTAPFCSELRARGLEDHIAAATGLTIDPLFSATKFRWLLDHVPDGPARAERGEVCLGTVDSWLLWQLTGGRVHASDLSNASRTQLLNLQTRTWDDDLLSIFGIPRAALPALVPSSGAAGLTAHLGRLAEGVPVGALIGDSHAALFGHAAFAPGSVKATYGTGSSLMTLLEAPVRSSTGLSTTIAWARGDRVWYALEGNITSTGGTVDWLARFLGADMRAAGVADLAATVPDAGGVYLVPAFAGLGAPHWDEHARGVISGLTGGSTAAHAARAAIESIAYQVRDVFEAMRADTAAALPVLLADGGASRNDRLMQFQADILGCPVVRHESTDLSAWGAAWLAGLATGVWASTDELTRLPQPATRFEPQMSEADRARLYGGWRDALARTRLRSGFPG